MTDVRFSPFCTIKAGVLTYISKMPIDLIDMCCVYEMCLPFGDFRYKCNVGGSRVYFTSRKQGYLQIADCTSLLSANCTF
jgi:hypothetical protein